MTNCVLFTMGTLSFVLIAISTGKTNKTIFITFENEIKMNHEK